MATTDTNPSPIVKWGLPAVLLLGALLRFFQLSKESLWLDEAASHSFASGDLARALAAELTNPPVYYTALHFWIDLFGESEAAMRSLSAFAGVAALVALFSFGRQLYGAKVAIAATAYMAISSFHIYYSQEARCFAMLSLFLLLSFWAMDAALERLPAWPGLMWIAYWFVTVASLYTHFISVMFVVAQNLYFVTGGKYYRKRIGGWVVVQLGVIVAFWPALMSMLQAAGEGGQTRRYLILKVPQTFFSFLLGDTLIPLNEEAVQNIAATLIDNAVLLGLAVAAFAILGFAAAWRFDFHSRSDRLCWIAAIVPTLVAFVVSLRTPMLDERYLIASSPFLYLALAAPAVNAIKISSGRLRAVVAASGLVVLGLAMLSLSNYYFSPRFGREQWRDVAAYVDSHRAPGDAIAFDVGYTSIPFLYYLPESGPVLKVGEGPTGADREQLLTALETHRRIWLVRSHFGNDESLATLREAGQEASHRKFPKAKGIAVYSFTAR